MSERPRRRLSRDQADALALAMYMYREKQKAGARPEELTRLREQFAIFGVDLDELTPDLEEHIRTNRYRGPMCLLLDGIGYDRELAKASVGPGWHGLIDEVWHFIERELPAGSVVIEQVKPKWTALRVYFQARDEDIYRRLDAFLLTVRDRSLTLCERCGAEGALPRRGGWIRTLCDAHAEGREAYPGAFREEAVTPESLAQDIAEAEENRRRAERGEQ